MKKALFALVALAAVFAVPAESMAGQAEVRLAPIRSSYAPPGLGRNQGWLTITNRDWKDYTVTIMKKGKMAINEGAAYGGTVIRSGTSVTIALEKDTWEMYGSSGEKLKCKVREGRTSTINLEPFGYVNNSGLRGVSNDGDKVRSQTLIENYAPPPVIIERPPVIVERPVIVPAPPPVIVNRPPIIVNRPHRPAPPPPPPRRPPHHNNRRDGWGFTFGYNSR